jgi:hypothetical protein
VVVLFWKDKGIRYLMLRYLNNRARLFKECAERWLLEGEV